MSKKQVLMLSIMTAIPAVILLAVLVLNGLEHGGAMFSGMMTVFVGLTFLLALFGVGLSPFAVMAWYPADGFAAAMPAVAPGSGGAAPRPMTDDDADEFEEDEGFDDEESYEDGGGEELFDDGYDDDVDDFEDEDEEWA